jgi:hypothetical protein
LFELFFVLSPEHLMLREEKSVDCQIFKKNDKTKKASAKNPTPVVTPKKL